MINNFIHSDIREIYRINLLSFHSMVSWRIVHTHFCILVSPPPLYDGCGCDIRNSSNLQAFLKPKDTTITAVSLNGVCDTVSALYKEKGGTKCYSPSPFSCSHLSCMARSISSPTEIKSK